MKNLLRQHFGLNDPVIKRLNGYDNVNYLVTDGAARYIWKTYPYEQELLDVLEAENAVLLHLQDYAGCHFPRPIPSADGTFIRVWDVTGQPTICRLLSFVEGVFLGDTALEEETLVSLGRILAQLDLQLWEINNYTIRARKWPWDIQYLELNRAYLPAITDPHDRAVVAYFMQQFAQHVSPLLPTLRKQIIYNDANEWNVLTQGNRVTGLIDFGDLAYSPLINELAVAITYACYNEVAPLPAAAILLRAYHEILPLKEQEIGILYYLIAARLCISVCNSAHARLHDPDNAYAGVSEGAAWAMLHRWIAINPRGAENCFREAVGLTPHPPTALAPKIRRRHRHLSPILSLSYTRPVPLRGAAFQYMYDADGHAILDAYNNIPHVGHCHPRVVAAGQAQLSTLNTNTRYLYDLLPRYAERLLERFPPSLNKVFLVNSGSAASDLALRLVHAHTQRHQIMVMEHGYHGNTQLGIDVSDYKFSNRKGQGQKDHVLKVPIPNTYRGKYTQNDGTAGRQYAAEAVALLRAFPTPIGAFLSESIVGCGGQVPLAKDYLQHIYPAVRAQGGVCISDEVQTGFGRLGRHFWGFEAQGVVPDIVILGKPIANGHPMGAVVCTNEIAASFGKGVEFFSSFGGNPVSCAIALAVLEVIEEEQLQAKARMVGDYYKSLLCSLQDEHPSIGDVRGSGLFLGVEMVKVGSLEPDPVLAKFIKNELRNRHILISTDGPYDSVLKTKPPLCFTKANAERVVAVMEEVIHLGLGCSICR